MESFNVINIDHNKGPSIRLKKTIRDPPPPKELEEIKPVIAEHASQRTTTSFC